MTDSASDDRPPLIPAVNYKDPRTALDWLEKAFGFEVSMLLLDADGNISHAEMSHGGGVMMIGPEWTAWTRSPASVEGANTQFVHVRLARDIDAHCERARAAGARILAEPADQFYGARTYRAFDPEGHCWTFSQPVLVVSMEDMEKASGLKHRTTL
jgi:uncharacterized glyoxalase superfamily protein PhnB